MTITINGTTGISGVDGSSATPAMQGADTNTGISYGTDTVTINTGGVARVTTDASGNVGIGVTPSAWSTGSSIRALQLGGGSFYSFDNNRIFVGQNVAITGADSDTYINTAAASAYRQFQGAHAWFTAPSGTAGSAILFTQAMTLSNIGVLSLAAYGTGTLYTNGGALTNINPSDRNLKDNITDIPWGLSEIMQLRPVTFSWKNDNANQGTQYGWIAQEVQEVMPDLVRTFEMQDGEETVTRLGLEKDGIYATLVKAIQEQQATISAMETRLAALEA
jgi:hypothetical protein